MAEIVYGHINDQGQLVILLSDDRVLNVGRVVGPPGPTGAQGRPGVPGPAGKDGAEIFLSAGPPDPAQGKPGDIAIDTVAWKLYQKSGMGWGSGNDMLPGANTLDSAIRRVNGGGGSGRFFPMGAPSAGISTYTAPPLTPTPTPLAGWNQISGYGSSLAGGSSVVVASDPSGLAFHVMLRGESSTGAHYMEVVATRLSGTSTVVDHVVAWEISLGTNPPILTPTASVNGNALELMVTTNQPLLSLTGAFQYL